jgi:hypothetical protein
MGARRGRIMMNNCKFLQYPHYCLICNTQIDMKKIERYIYDCISYEHNPELMRPYRENDPIVVRDYGNDVEIDALKTVFANMLDVR